jgi:hypothetical protein
MVNGNNITFAFSYIDISHSANAISYTDFNAGDDGILVAAKAGYYLGSKIWQGNLQPYAQLQYIHSDESGDKDTLIYGGGLNYYINGPGNKLTLDLTSIDQERELADTFIQDHMMVTVQLAVGF